MKFWKKIFLYSVVLFLLLFSGGGIILIEKIHNDNLQTAIESAMNMYLNTKSVMDLHIDKFLDLDINNNSSIKNWVEVTVNGYSTNKANTNCIELYSKDNNMIMSDFDKEIPGQRKEILSAKSDELSFIIRTIDNRKYVFISSIIQLQNKEFKMVISKDIEEVYMQRIENYKFFILLDIMIFIILAIGMYIISKNLTNPLVKLSNISKEIAKGEYSKRVEKTNTLDEIGVLENNFNIMIDVIEDNIKELKFLNESKQRFIDSLNHEIKTPITSIIGYSDLLLKSKVTEEMRIKALSYINSEARRLESLNSTLLKLILIREEKDEMIKINMNEVISNSVSMLSYKLEQKNIKVEMNIEDEQIYADKQLIVVLISNLMDNAIKASYENSEINIYGYIEKNNNYILKIKDYGIGIPKEDIDKVLEPFYMVDKARTRKNNGVGLGLTICSEICKIYNISINIESELNIGTEITLTFNKDGIGYEN